MWLLDGSPASGGEIHSPRFASAAWTGQHRRGRLETFRERAREEPEFGRLDRRERCFHHHRSGDHIDDLEHLAGGSAEKLVVRQWLERSRSVLVKDAPCGADRSPPKNSSEATSIPKT